MIKLALAASLVLLGADGVRARSLKAVMEGGALTLCAHPNALPYASRDGELHGRQIEIGEALAARLGVKLTRAWVVNTFQMRRAGCDIVLDAIGDQAAHEETGLRISRPYNRGGVTLAVTSGSKIAALTDLGKDQRVGVQVGSIASMRLGKAGIGTSPFGFEDEMLEELQSGALDAAAVTPSAVGWFNLKHPDAPLRQIAAFDDDPDLNWDVGVGMLSPDDKLRQSIDAALEALLADGTIARIYTRYGMTLRPPK